MTTCRGCGAFFTEGHDEVRCELVAQILVERRDWNEREAKYLDELDTFKKWRLLAIQFDCQRMEAMALLKMVAAGDFDVERIKTFLATAPRSGQQCLSDVKAEAFEAGARQFRPESNRVGIIKELAKKYGES